MSRLATLLCVASILVVAASSAAAQAGQSNQLKIEKWSLSGNVLTLEISVQPSIESPGGSPENGEIALKWEKEVAGGYSESAPNICEGPSWIGTGTKYTLYVKINAPWTGKLSLTLRKTGVGGFELDPVYIFLDLKVKVVKAETGSAQSPTTVVKLCLIPGDTESIFLRVRSPVDEGMITSENGKYYLQIEGPENGSACFTFSDGTSAKEIQFVNGEAEITLMAQVGATWAYLVGFDSVRNPSNSEVLGGFRILLVSE